MLESKKKLIVVAAGIIFLFSLLVVQFFRIQIVEGDKWNRYALRQHYFEIDEPFIRGTFYSNPTVKRGHPEEAEKLAIDVYKYHLYIDPKAIPKKLRQEVGGKIIGLTNPTVQEMKLVFSQFEKKSRSRKVVSWIPEKKKNELLAWWRPFARKQKIEQNALFFVRDCKRTHPFGKMLGQVLHTVQDVKDDVTQKAYPTGGLELSFDKQLRGNVGKIRLKRSPRHSLEASQVLVIPKNGADIYLTVNHCLQAICEEEIEKGVKSCKAKSGWAVMMDPNTGFILALAQYPFFYPDEYAKYFNSKELAQETKVKAITDAHEPGSVMKPFSLAITMKANKILLEQGKAAIYFPMEKLDTSSGKFPGRSKPMTDTHFHHYLNAKLGMMKSSNIYLARMIQRVTEKFGDAWYRNELVSFGFGSKTGIELPGESSGLLPRQGKLHPNGRPEWSKPTPFSLAIGYNIQTTSLQMIRAFAVFANGGKLVEPTLVRKIVRKEDGVTLLDNTKEERIKQFPTVIDKKIVDDVVDMMKLVTKPFGTARRADIYGYTEAGKTSTDMKLVNGSYSSKKHVASFVGFAPVSKPAFILFIAMDEPLAGFIPGKGLNHHGGLAAAPVFREIGKRSLEYMGIPPDDPHGYPKSDPRYNAAIADTVGEAKQLEELYYEWNGKH